MTTSDRATSDITVVHLMRHGEVAQPGRRALRPPARLPPLRAGPADGRPGRRAPRRRVTSPMSSPPRWSGPRRRPTPIAKAHGLDVATDERLIEAANVFQGKTFGVGDGALRKPGQLEAPHQPVPPVLGRAVRRPGRADDGRAGRGAGRRARARGGAASATSCRSGSCAASSSGGGCGTTRASGSARWRRLTSFTYRGDRIVSVGYSEPARDLVPAHLLAGAKPVKGASKGFGA